METQAARQTHPLLIVAAISITLFSLVGIGAVLGWIPTSCRARSPILGAFGWNPERTSRMDSHHAWPLAS
jgi:hypothetical protein